MIRHEDQQSNFYDERLEQLVTSDHAYRKLRKLIDFSKLLKPLENLYSETGAPSQPLQSGFKALLLQYWEDLSDREAERYMRENIVARWFCGYGLDENTPDHSYFGKLRKRIGVERLSKLFEQVNKMIEASGHVGNVFHFVDASSLLSRISVWEARDKAMSDKENKNRDDHDNPKMNNQNVGDYSPDPDARFGCKGKDKYWYGYKRHHRVDMRQGLITKVAVTSADITDAQAFVAEGLCPREGMVFLDKGYDCVAVDEHIVDSGCFDATIRKKNRKMKNRDLDRWRSSVRMPYENTFSKMKKQARYRGRQKVHFQALFEALVHNFKRLLIVQAAPLLPV